MTKSSMRSYFLAWETNSKNKVLQTPDILFIFLPKRCLIIFTLKWTEEPIKIQTIDYKQTLIHIKPDPKSTLGHETWWKSDSSLFHTSGVQIHHPRISESNPSPVRLFKSKSKYLKSKSIKHKLVLNWIQTKSGFGFAHHCSILASWSHCHTMIEVLLSW